MTAQRPWLLCAASGGVFLAGSLSRPDLVPLAFAIWGLMLCLSVPVVLRTVRRDAEPRLRIRSTWILLAKLVLGSLAVGGLYLLAAQFSQYRGPVNLIGLVAVPMTIALILRPRVSSLALTLPLFVGGCFWFVTLGVAYRITVD